MHQKLGIVIAVIVFSTVYLLLRPNRQSGPETGDKIFESFLKNAKNINSIEANYESIRTTPLSGVYVDGKFYRKGPDMLIDGRLSGQGMPAYMAVRYYVLGDKFYSCLNRSGLWECINLGPPMLLNDAFSLGEFKKLFHKKSLVFSAPYAKTVNGKACIQLNATMDIAKLSKDEKSSLISVLGLGPEDDGPISNFFLNPCVVDGVAVETEIEFYRGEHLHKERILITDYTLNKAMPATLFALPA